jgi:hypothetical protein
MRRMKRLTYQRTHHVLGPSATAVSTAASAQAYLIDRHQLTASEHIIKSAYMSIVNPICCETVVDDSLNCYFRVSTCLQTSCEFTVTIRNGELLTFSPCIRTVGDGGLNCCFCTRLSIGVSRRPLDAISKLPTFRSRTQYVMGPLSMTESTATSPRAY